MPDAHLCVCFRFRWSDGLSYHIYILQIKLRDNIVRTVTLMHVSVTKYNYTISRIPALPSHGQTNDMLFFFAFVAVLVTCSVLRAPILYVAHSYFLPMFFFSLCSPSAPFLCWLHINIWVRSRAYVSTQCSTTKSRINILYLFGRLCVCCVNVPAADFYFSESVEMGCPYIAVFLHFPASLFFSPFFVRNSGASSVDSINLIIIII